MVVNYSLAVDRATDVFLLLLIDSFSGGVIIFLAKVRLLDHCLVVFVTFLTTKLLRRASDLGINLVNLGKRTKLLCFALGLVKRHLC